MRKLNWKKLALRAFWLLAGIGMIVLLGAAIQKKNQKPCTDIRIEITGENKHLFIDEKDVLRILNSGRPVKGSSLSDINLRSLEERVEKDPWVRQAEMFIDNNQVLQVRIEERQPVARVFTVQGRSFYLDSDAMRLPLSEKLSARVPVFTDFPSDKPVLAKPDSALLSGIVKMGRFIGNDSFWMAQVAQVAITPQAGFDIIPVIGDHTVAFGPADNIAPKFKRLYTFYKKAWLQNGMNTYEKLDVQYDNQVVAVKKGTAKAMIDSARARQLLQHLLSDNSQPFKDSGSIAVPTPVLTKKVDTPARSVAATRIIPAVIKPVAKTNSVAVKNNKTGIKPLTKGAKTKQAVNKTKSKPPPKPVHPKAVMEKNKNQ